MQRTIRIAGITGLAALAACDDAYFGRGPSDEVIRADADGVAGDSPVTGAELGASAGWRELDEVEDNLPQ